MSRYRCQKITSTTIRNSRFNMVNSFVEINSSSSPSTLKSAINKILNNIAAHTLQRSHTITNSATTRCGSYKKTCTVILAVS